jgi:hypothetical protein
MCQELIQLQMGITGQYQAPPQLDSYIKLNKSKYSVNEYIAKERQSAGHLNGDTCYKSEYLKTPLQWNSPSVQPDPTQQPPFTSSAQPSWLLGCPRTSYTCTKMEMKCEPGIKVEDEGEDRNDEGPAIMAQPGPSDLDWILMASNKLWYTHMPSLSPNDDILNVYTLMPTPPQSPEYPHFYNYQGELLTAEEAE